MNQASPTNPALSPGFDRARKLSRIMAVIFTIGFWLTLLAAILVLAVPFVPGNGMVGFYDVSVSLNGLSFTQRAWVTLAMEMVALPMLFLTHHARRLFGHFARGEVFVLPVIADIRQAGLWLIVSFFANIAGETWLLATKTVPPGHVHETTWPLLIGIVTFIAAYVMEEAQRIAADNAEIV
jgi:hypothetical protein